MPQKEASARIKINKLLEAAGWRFFDEANGPANISLEANVKLIQQQVDAMGDDFETASHGFIASSCWTIRVLPCSFWTQNLTVRENHDGSNEQDL